MGQNAPSGRAHRAARLEVVAAPALRRNSRTNARWRRRSRTGGGVSSSGDREKPFRGQVKAIGRCVMDRAGTVIGFGGGRRDPTGRRSRSAPRRTRLGRRRHTFRRRRSAAPRSRRDPSATALRFRAWATGSAERVTEVGGAAIGSAIRWIRVAGVVIERHGSKQEVSGRSDGFDGWRFVFGGW